MASKKDNRANFMKMIGKDETLTPDAAGNDVTPEAAPEEKAPKEAPIEPKGKEDMPEMGQINDAIDSFKSEITSGADVKSALNTLIDTLTKISGEQGGEEAPLNMPGNM